MLKSPLSTKRRLEDLDRDELLVTVRTLLAEANALSSRIAAVNEIGIAINQSLDLDEILQSIASKAKWLLDFEHCSMCLQEPNGMWSFHNIFGATETYDSAMIWSTPNIGFVLRTGQARIIAEGSPSPLLDTYASQLILPLSVERTVMGTINFASQHPKAYTQDDLRIGYMFALQLASAIRNASHVQALTTAHQELRHYAQELEERNQELDAYSHTIAHDLKSPLSSILLKVGYVQMRYGKAMPERANEVMDGIGNHVKQMASMIDQLLWLAKLRDVEENVVEVDANPVVTAALERFGDLIRVRHITVSVMENMPPAVGFPQWLEEIFANLISNAIKYMGDDNPNPSITIRAEADDYYVYYEVTDTGVGIAESDQARLFEMFTRLHTVKADGLGLGLSIVHRMVGKLNGHVGVRSELGKGSTFWFRVPTRPV